MPEEVENNQLKKLKWRRFLIKNLLIYLAPNVIFNALIPYIVFKQQGSVQLLDGKENLIRFLLPMSLLLPFILTFDILKKTIEAALKKQFHLELDKSFPKRRFIFRMASWHALLTFFTVSLFVLSLHLFMPAGYQYDITISSLFIGTLAGIYSLLFPVLSINKLKKSGHLI